MHWYATDGYLTTLADVHFPGRPFRIGLFAAGGRTFRLLAVEGRPPIVEWDFLDFCHPVSDEPDPSARPIAFVPRAALSAAEIGGTPEIAPGSEPAPFIRWERFPDWKAFEAHYASRRSSLLRDARQKRRNLEKDLGPVQFVWDDHRPEVFERCVAWKSAQYDRTGVVDLFRKPESARFFQALHARGLLVVSSMSAGDVLLSVHFGGLADGRMYSWIASYDPQYARYSAGRLLLEDMLRESQAHGHEEWDFGIGDMDYKWHYATHNRVIGPVGRLPLARVVGNAAREGMKRALGRYPALFDGARRLRKRIQEGRLRG